MGRENGCDGHGMGKENGWVMDSGWGDWLGKENGFWLERRFLGEEEWLGMEKGRGF